MKHNGRISSLAAGPSRLNNLKIHSHQVLEERITGSEINLPNPRVIFCCELACSEDPLSTLHGRPRSLGIIRDLHRPEPCTLHTIDTPRCVGVLQCGAWERVQTGRVSNVQCLRDGSQAR